jgi:hypothetical protein
MLKRIKASLHRTIAVGSIALAGLVLAIETTVVLFLFL